MKKTNTLFTILLFCIPFWEGYAQPDAFEKDQFYPDYDWEFTYGINFNTNGSIVGGFTFKYARHWRERYFEFYGLEFVNVKHPKEITRVSNASGQTYIMYKQHQLFSIRPQYGREIILFNKAEDEGIQVNGILAGGISMGILKPYFVLHGDSRSTADPKPYTPDLDLGKIYGSAGFFKGLGKSEIIPGLNAKASATFEFGNFNSNISGIEAGFMVEAFPKEMVIISNVENQNIFTSAFVVIYWGHRK